MQTFFEMWFILFIAKTILATEDAGNDTDISHRIIGGAVVSPEEFKFVVGLQTEFSDGSAPMRCTGTVLDQHTVLTAGHCVRGFKNITVYVNCKNVVQCLNTRAGTGMLHPDYRIVNKTAINDIGVVKTTEEIGAEEVTQLAEPAPPYSSCIVVGYGKTLKEGSETTDRLLYKLNMTDIVWCETIFPGDSRYQNTLCAYVQNEKQPYLGDSGGPLLCNETQVGVTSQELPSVKQGGGQLAILWIVPDNNTNWVTATVSGSPVSHLLSLLVLMLSPFTAPMLS